MLWYSLSPPDGYDTSNVILKWMDSSPVEIDEAALKLPQFELEDIENVSCEESYKTGSMWQQKYILLKLTAKWMPAFLSQFPLPC